jgi:predicted NAD-dependent protein-ADP-ribosyltransferase YbiA (DUF1768 family)
MTAQQPLIIAYYDGDSEVRLLSNFATTPFVLDDISYLCVEGFWQSLKTEYPVIRERFQHYEGLDAKQAGRLLAKAGGGNLFTYQGNLYRVGSEEHHILLERAIRAKVDHNKHVRDAILATENRPLKHMLKNRFGSWKPGDSPALPAITFENMYYRIRKELQDNTFTPTLPLPKGINEFAE